MRRVRLTRLSRQPKERRLQSDMGDSLLDLRVVTEPIGSSCTALATRHPMPHQTQRPTPRPVRVGQMPRPPRRQWLYRHRVQRRYVAFSIWTSLQGRLSRLAPRICHSKVRASVTSGQGIPHVWPTAPVCWDCYWHAACGSITKVSLHSPQPQPSQGLIFTMFGPSTCTVH